MSESSEANKVQVGGSHYKTGYEHWDLVAKTGMGYFTGQVTRYVARWRKKDGVQDLEKALHYLNKLVELLRDEFPSDAFDGPSEDDEELVAEVTTFAKANDLWEDEHAIIRRVVLMRDWDDVYTARDTVEKLIAGARPAPRTDSNKHAAQEG